MSFLMPSSRDLTSLLSAVVKILEEAQRCWEGRSLLLGMKTESCLPHQPTKEEPLASPSFSRVELFFMMLPLAILQLILVYFFVILDNISSFYFK